MREGGVCIYVLVGTMLQRGESDGVCKGGGSVLAGGGGVLSRERDG